MKFLTVAAVSAAVLAGGCASDYGNRWHRMDGRPIDESFDWAMSKCRRLASGYDEGSATAMKRCMSRRGYVWGPNGYSGNY